MRRLLFIVAMLGAAGCRRHRMTAVECGQVLDRIVSLELAERGFRDPALAARRQRELRDRFADELSSCTGRRARADVSACVQNAHSAEEIGHGCLR